MRLLGNLGMGAMCLRMWNECMRTRIVVYQATIHLDLVIQEMGETRCFQLVKRALAANKNSLLQGKDYSVVLT